MRLPTARSLTALLLLATSPFALVACSDMGMGKTSRAMASPDSDMQAVLDAQASLKPKPITGLSAAEARKQASPADGAHKVMKMKGMNPADPMGVETMTMTIAGSPATLYRPKGSAQETLPVIVYYHGGGFVIATNETYDATPRAMAGGVHALVVSVEYPKAPEHKFPASHDAAFAAYKWVVINAARIGGDARRVAVMGESAGGNLAIDTAIAARDAGFPLPVYQVLVYPVAGVDMNTPSYLKYADAKPLNKPMMGWFFKNETRSPNDATDPRLDIVGRADLHGLPATTIIAAQIDPLNSEGRMLAGKLSDSGVSVNYANYDGVTHEFFGMGAVVGDAKDAEGVAISDLKSAFSN